MLKQNLKNGMILELRNSARFLLANGRMIDLGGLIELEVYNEDLKHKASKDYDIIKVYEISNGLSLMSIFEDICLSLIWERKEIKLTDREIEMLKALKILGLEWLARDKNGRLFVYGIKPKKYSDTWSDEEEHYYLSIKEKDLFNFIKWEDEAPTDIDDLLKGV